MVPEGSDELSENDELREYELSGSDCNILGLSGKLSQHTILDYSRKSSSAALHTKFTSLVSSISCRHLEVIIRRLRAIV